MKETNMADNDVELDSDREMEMDTQSDEQSAEEIERLLREADISDIPDTLIVTNVADSVFDDRESKEEFEKTFAVYDENVTFQYFKSFRRARVNFSSPLFSANARIDLHEADVLGQRIKCFFFQPITLGGEENPHLQLPAPQKQYLISPPASPPVDWEPCFEKKPVINYDLLAALAKLAPGQAHEIHPPSKDQPGIVVHICEDPEGYVPGGCMIPQTRCPERKT